MMRDRLRNELSIDIDPGDAWGTAIGALFDVAHALEHYGNVPAHWQYRDSMGCRGLDKHPENDAARYLASLILRGHEAEIVHAGNVLERYTRCLERAGQSY